MPFDAKGTIAELVLVAILKVEDQSMQSRVRNEFIVRMVVVFVASLRVDTESFGLVEKQASLALEGYVSEFRHQFLDQRCVLES